jgi:DNA-binding MarR family transcriptional regulator
LFVNYREHVASGVSAAATGSGEDPSEGVDARPRAEEIVSLVFALVDRMRAHFEASIAEFELSPPQAKALRYLATARGVPAGGVPMRELAVILHCDASYVTGIVDRLEQRGLVQRRASLADRRVKALVLTVEGQQLSALVWERVIEKAPPVHGLVPSEQQALLGLLRRLHGGDGDLLGADPMIAPPPFWCHDGRTTPSG